MSSGRNHYFNKIFTAIGKGRIINAMANWIKSKLLYKFLFLFLPFIFVSIGITGVVLSFTNYKFFQKTITQDYENIIRGSAGEIRLFMENARRNLESLALLMTATGLDDWGREMALTAFLHKNTQFISLSLLSPDGKRKITTQLDGPGSGNFVLDDNDRLLLKTALSGQTAISGVMPGREELPVVRMAVPVPFRGEVANILWATLNLKSIWDILEGIRIGQSGQIYLMDLSGRTIAHHEIDRVIKPPPTDKADVIATLRTADTPTQWFEEKDGIRFYNLGARVPGLDWIIVLNQPSREIYNYLYRNIFWAVLSVVCFCGIAILFAWVWIRRLLKPIASLHDQVRTIGKGDLDRKVSVVSEDEIGDLGRAFNDMTDSLKEYLRREIETAQKLVHAQNLAVLGTASSKVTHEVGNFLNNTDMALTGLRRETLSERGEKILGILDNESSRVKDFMQRFLRFARKPELNLTRQPLGPIIQDVLDVYQEAAGKRGVRLEFNWPESLPPINLDSGMISQALHNLIKNSLDAINGNGAVTISGELNGASLVLTITDTGSGIDADVQGRIFEPFFTTKGKAGNGLGMALVKTIVEAHRGTIECRSTVGQGTSFIVHLPLDG